MFKIKITLFFTQAPSFFGLPRPSQTPNGRCGWCFSTPHSLTTLRDTTITTTWRSIAKVPPEPFPRSPREAAKNAQKGKHMKKISPVAFFRKKQKKHGFSKTPVKTPGGGCTVPIFGCLCFFSPKSLDDDPLRIGIAFGGPALFSKKGDSTSEREMYVQNDEKWYGKIKRNH